MYVWMKWRNPIVVFAVAVMLAVAAYGSVVAASDLNDAADAQVMIGSLSKAAADFELAWFMAMGADALAATGQAPDESQGFYDGALNLYDSSKAVLSAAGISQIDQALAASDQGLVAMNAAFDETMRLARQGDIIGATDNHMDGTVVLYGSVDPAVKGLAQVAQAADARLESSIDSGASKLRLVGWISVGVVALGALFAGWSAWSIYRKDEDEAASMPVEQSQSMDRAA